jgi:hypothetical protein
METVSPPFRNWMCELSGMVSWEGTFPGTRTDGKPRANNILDEGGAGKPWRFERPVDAWHCLRSRNVKGPPAAIRKWP